MAVTIQIGVDRLNDPSVAKALANLVLALGGAATGQKKPADAPALKPEAPKPAAPAAAPAPAPAAAAEPAPAKTRKTRKAAPAKAEKPAPAKAPAAEKPAADDVAARYEAFVSNLPERSRAFLDLLKQRGTLTINEAMEALDISVSKAMGGITGSIGRWAPVRGVPVPYEASMVDGVRTWTWIGGPDGAAPAKAADAPKKARKSSAKKDGAKKGAKKGKTTRSASKKGSSAKKAAAPAPKADEGSVAQRYRDFVSNLPERSQQFIELVRERKLLTISDAMEALGLTVPKAMGGITGSIGRWAPVRGIPVPYEATTVDGERAWKWLGAPTDEGNGGSPKAEAPAGVTPEASSPEGANSAEDTREAAIEAIIDELPERASLFVRTLRQRGMMTMQEVLDTFSLAKARAVSGIVDPIFTAFRDADIAPPFEATFAPTGDKAWVWSKPAQAAVAEQAPAEDPADARGVSSARPGVRVRRRAR